MIVNDKKMKLKSNKNALVNEASPYLLQHADNPVHWYPWGEAAITKARHEDKPILLSIGYSACHWCHVMAHESFEDDETAKIMNEHFINIKVDREERPDLDKIYQMAQQLLTQRSGGWPLTMFLTPDDHLPFFGGTYFPLESRFGLPGFKELLVRVAQFYKDERESITKQNLSMRNTLVKMSTALKTDGKHELDSEPLSIAIRQLAENFDDKFGGFGEAPKFPHPMNIELLLRYHVHTQNKDAQALTMAQLTLRKMAQGGIYDHLGGGFCRYSVDEQWMIPHFEKMLYDNGPLLTLYSQAWQISKDPLFKTVAIETADWVMRDMQSDEGGYYSTLDADSEGVEGKFYVWTREELESLLEKQEYKLFAAHYGLDQGPNFEGEWHLRVVSDIESVAETLSMTIDQARQQLNQTKQKLLDVRNQRIWPGRDEKILTSWNSLMIKGMATAALTFDRIDYLDSAVRALEFIHNTLCRDNYLLATYKDGKAHLNAYLDDYAFLIDAILTMLESRWNTEWLTFAIKLADTLLEAFGDKDNGGFFFTSHHHEKLIQRSKPYMDDALPAGNGIAAYVLGRLGHLLGEERYTQASERSLKAAWPSILGYPSAHNALLLALEEYLKPPRSIIIRGNEASMKTWQNKCRQLSSPFGSTLCIPKSKQSLPDSLSIYKPLENTVAYICEGHQCSAPITQLDLLAENLNN